MAQTERATTSATLKDVHLAFNSLAHRLPGRMLGQGNLSKAFLQTGQAAHNSLTESIASVYSSNTSDLSTIQAVCFREVYRLSVRDSTR